MEIETIRNTFPQGNIRIDGKVVWALYPYEDAISTESWENERKKTLCDMLKNAEEVRVIFDPRASALALKFRFEVSGESLQYVRKIKPITSQEYERASNEIMDDLKNHPEKHAEALDTFWRYFNGADFEDEDDIRARGVNWLSEIIDQNSSHILSLSKLDKWSALKELARKFHQSLPRYELEFNEPEGDTASFMLDLFEEKEKIKTTPRGNSLKTFIDIIELLDCFYMGSCGQGITINGVLDMSQ